MNSAQALEMKMQAFTDQINDLIHATSLNLLALKTQSNQQKQMIQIIQDAQKQFQLAVNLFKQRQQLRLNYLIIEQIKQQQAKVRRQRLMEYQQKIYDQRRLISDKQAFYESLLRPKRKKPASITPQQYQQMRKKQANQQEQRHLEMMSEQVKQMQQLQDIINIQNNKLKMFVEDNNQYENTLKTRQFPLNLATQNPQIYAIIKKQGLTPKSSDIRQMIQSVSELKQQNKTILNQLQQERQMQQYLQWQKKKLLQQYEKLYDNFMGQHLKKKQNQKNKRKNRLMEMNMDSDINKSTFVRPVSL